jgi:hypothetical protein
MQAKLTELIDKQDTNEIVRDQIAAILAIEIDKQKDLAVIAGKNPVEWDVDIYIEKSRPWELLSDENGEEISETPLVNVSFDNDVFDNKGSDAVGNQKVVGTFYIDCYAHKNSYRDDYCNLIDGDTLTSRESDKVARLVRNIIMAGPYTYLGLQKTVFKRYINRREKFNPSDREGKYFENVIVTRITLNVDYKEYSPQAETTDIETLIANCKVGDDGLVEFNIEFDLTE